eukprot:TRINITY_DN5139_c0_g1_i2.p1 TRINITY_DN5139_c0_g1~~TRINITY_DN5139_c0_g1_i2.p1  ORF type:complete len:1552 (+),score=301.96 TRINITY_DN5139_c0_g1_i2:76-4656(+)
MQPRESGPGKQIEIDRGSEKRPRQHEPTQEEQRDYIRAHGLHTVLREVLGACVEERPEDPALWVADRLMHRTWTPQPKAPAQIPEYAACPDPADVPQRPGSAAAGRPTAWSPVPDLPHRPHSSASVSQAGVAWLAQEIARSALGHAVCQPPGPGSSDEREGSPVTGGAQPPTDVSPERGWTAWEPQQQESATASGVECGGRLGRAGASSPDYAELDEEVARALHGRGEGGGGAQPRSLEERICAQRAALSRLEAEWAEIRCAELLAAAAPGAAEVAQSEEGTRQQLLHNSVLCGEACKRAEITRTAQVAGALLIAESCRSKLATREGLVRLTTVAAVKRVVIMWSERIAITALLARKALDSSRSMRAAQEAAQRRVVAAAERDAWGALAQREALGRGAASTAAEARAAERNALLAVAAARRCAAAADESRGREQLTDSEQELWEYLQRCFDRGPPSAAELAALTAATVAVLLVLPGSLNLPPLTPSVNSQAVLDVRDVSPTTGSSGSHKNTSYGQRSLPVTAGGSGSRARPPPVPSSASERSQQNAADAKAAVVAAARAIPLSFASTPAVPRAGVLETPCLVSPGLTQGGTEPVGSPQQQLQYLLQQGAYPGSPIPVDFPVAAALRDRLASGAGAPRKLSVTWDNSQSRAHGNCAVRPSGSVASRGSGAGRGRGAGRGTPSHVGSWRTVMSQLSFGSGLTLAGLAAATPGSWRSPVGSPCSGSAAKSNEDFDQATQLLRLGQSRYSSEAGGGFAPSPMSEWGNLTLGSHFGGQQASPSVTVMHPAVRGVLNSAASSGAGMLRMAEPTVSPEIMEFLRNHAACILQRSIRRRIAASAVCRMRIALAGQRARRPAAALSTPAEPEEVPAELCHALVLLEGEETARRAAGAAAWRDWLQLAASTVRSAGVRTTYLQTLERRMRSRLWRKCLAFRGQCCAEAAARFMLLYDCEVARTALCSQQHDLLLASTGQHRGQHTDIACYVEAAARDEIHHAEEMSVIHIVEHHHYVLSESAGRRHVDISWAEEVGRLRGLRSVPAHHSLRQVNGVAELEYLEYVFRQRLQSRPLKAHIALALHALQLREAAGREAVRNAAMERPAPPPPPLPQRESVDLRAGGGLKQRSSNSEATAPLAPHQLGPVMEYAAAAAVDPAVDSADQPASPAVRDDIPSSATAGSERRSGPSSPLSGTPGWGMWVLRCAPRFPRWKVRAQPDPDGEVQRRLEDGARVRALPVAGTREAVSSSPRALPEGWLRIALDFGGGYTRREMEGVGWREDFSDAELQVEKSPLAPLHLPGALHSPQARRRVSKKGRPTKRPKLRRGADCIPPDARVVDGDLIVTDVNPAMWKVYVGAMTAAFIALMAAVVVGLLQSSMAALAPFAVLLVGDVMWLYRVGWGTSVTFCDAEEELCLSIHHALCTGCCHGTQYFFYSELRGVSVSATGVVVGRIAADQVLKVPPLSGITDGLPLSSDAASAAQWARFVAVRASARDEGPKPPAGNPLAAAEEAPAEHPADGSSSSGSSSEDSDSQS